MVVCKSLSAIAACTVLCCGIQAHAISPACMTAHWQSMASAVAERFQPASLSGEQERMLQAAFAYKERLLDARTAPAVGPESAKVTVV